MIRDVSFQEMTLDELFELEDNCTATLGNTENADLMIPEEFSSETSAIINFVDTSSTLFFNDLEEWIGDATQAKDTRRPSLFRGFTFRNDSSWYTQGYLMPVYAFVRGCKYNRSEAERLTLTFVCEFLPKQRKLPFRKHESLRVAMLNSLRSYILIAPHRPHSPGTSDLVLARTHEELAEFLYWHASQDEPTADILYDQAWAVNLLSRVHDNLESECKTEAHRKIIHCLKAVVTSGSTAADYDAIIRSLEFRHASDEASFRTLRGRYFEILRREVALTVTTSAEIPEEIRYLANVLKKRAW